MNQSALIKLLKNNIIYWIRSDIELWLCVTKKYYKILYEMFVRMLTVHCDQNDSYEKAINGFQVRKMNEIINVNVKVEIK